MTLPVNQVLCGDCLDFMRTLPDGCIDAVITDPPYPDYHAELYGYREGMIDFLADLPCRQLIFWSAKVDFPLDYTAIHIWDKRVGCGSQYERIFERNGGKEWKVFKFSVINSPVTAGYVGDIWTGHPSQKPTGLLCRLIERISKPGDLILDPFCGSGSTLTAAERLGRRWIGVDISEEYCAIARKRTAQKGLDLQAVA